VPAATDAANATAASGNKAGTADGSGSCRSPGRASSAPMPASPAAVSARRSLVLSGSTRNDEAVSAVIPRFCFW